MKLECMMDCGYKAGDVVKANYTFKKDKNEDLPFRKNDTLEIINIGKDPNWAHAKNTLGETGLIPLNYVQRKSDALENLQNHNWYHGRISRAESESLLSGSPVGSFLIRESDLYSGDLTLCVVGPPCVTASSDIINECHGSSVTPSSDTTTTNVQHYRIVRRPFRSVNSKQHFEYSTTTSSICSKIHYTLDETDWFSSLLELVQFYSQPKRGLVCELHHPVPDMQRKRLSHLQKLGYLIFRKDIVLGDRIGRGEFGEVLKATYLGRQVAVKIYKKTASKLAITYEASLMTKINHPNLVSFIGLVYEPDDAVYLVTEYLANGSLLTYLHSRTRDEITELTKLKFSIDVCRGLVYLEERDFIHRDIAARNVLLSGQVPNLIAKVADFGMARDLHDLSTIGSISHQPKSSNTPTLVIRNFLLTDTVEKYPPIHHDGHHQSTEVSTSPASLNPMVLHDNAAIPLKWTAPEAIRDRLFTTKSDVWSFGILLWEIYSYGRIPYPRMMANQVLRHIESGYRMKSPEDCPSTVYAIMLHTWQNEPNNRPSFVEILSELIQLYNTSTSMSTTMTSTTTAVAVAATTTTLPSTISISNPTSIGVTMTLQPSPPPRNVPSPSSSTSIPAFPSCPIVDLRKATNELSNRVLLNSSSDRKTPVNYNTATTTSNNNNNSSSRITKKQQTDNASNRHRHIRPRTLAELVAEPSLSTYHNEMVNSKSPSRPTSTMSRSFIVTTKQPKNTTNHRLSKTPDESKLPSAPLERLKL